MPWYSALRKQAPALCILACGVLGAILDLDDANLGQVPKCELEGFDFAKSPAKNATKTQSVFFLVIISWGGARKCTKSDATTCAFLLYCFAPGARK